MTFYWTSSIKGLRSMRPNDEINTPNKFSDESGKHAKHKLAAFFVSSSQSEVFYKTLDIRNIHGKTPELYYR